MYINNDYQEDIVISGWYHVWFRTAHKIIIHISWEKEHSNEKILTNKLAHAREKVTSKNSQVVRWIEEKQCDKYMHGSYTQLSYSLCAGLCVNFLQTNIFNDQHLSIRSTILTGIQLHIVIIYLFFLEIFF